MHHEEKLRLAHQIAALGVDVLEAGFAIASDGDLAAIQAVAREVRGPRIASLARCKREDIEAAARAVEAAPSNRIHLVLASSDLHLEYKLRITRDQALDQAAKSVRLARSFPEDVEFSTEDGTRSDPELGTPQEREIHVRLRTNTGHFGTLIAPDWMPSAICSRILA
jgi:2-isopropylmalate synthase